MFTVHLYNGYRGMRSQLPRQMIVTQTIA